MTKEERLEWLKCIEKDIYVSSLESTFADDSKSCAIHSIIEELEQEPTTKNDLGVRGFEGINVTYPPEELCAYPEYKGKPYFGIKYKENGEEIVGYGTYNPEVLSRYLKDYFIPTTKNDLGVDCISRVEVKKIAKEMYLEVANMELDVNTISDCISYTSSKCREVLERKLQTLPSVTPQEPRWIPVTERLPQNAKHKGAFCPKYYVMTEYGATEGWYNPDVKCWYVLLWFMDERFKGWNINLDRGDVPKLVKNVPVIAWMSLPEIYRGCDNDK